MHLDGAGTSGRVWWDCWLTGHPTVIFDGYIHGIQRRPFLDHHEFDRLLWQRLATSKRQAKKIDYGKVKVGTVCRKVKSRLNVDQLVHHIYLTSPHVCHVEIPASGSTTMDPKQRLNIIITPIKNDKRAKVNLPVSTRLKCFFWPW